MTVKIYFINFVVVLVGITLGSYLFFVLSGWKELARHYKVKRSILTTLSRWQTGSVGNIFMRNCLNVGINKEGLFLSIFSLFYPPLLIPWDDITKAQPTTKRYLRDLRYYNLTVGKPTITTISLPKETLEAAEQILATKR